MPSQLNDQPQDFRVGWAIVPEHLEGGWALPGGGQTNDLDEVLTVGRAMARYIDEHGGRPAVLRKGRRPGGRNAA